MWRNSHQIQPGDWQKDSSNLGHKERFTESDRKGGGVIYDLVKNLTPGGGPRRGRGYKGLKDHC